jgi:hypothetical protein
VRHDLSHGRRGWIAAAGNHSGCEVTVRDDADWPAVCIKYNECPYGSLAHPFGRLKSRFTGLGKINLSLTNSSDAHGGPPF